MIVERYDKVVIVFLDISFFTLNSSSSNFLDFLITAYYSSSLLTTLRLLYRFERI